MHTYTQDEVERIKAETIVEYRTHKNRISRHKRKQKVQEIETTIIVTLFSVGMPLFMLLHWFFVGY